jgi:hypothetical protein
MQSRKAYIVCTVRNVRNVIVLLSFAFIPALRGLPSESSLRSVRNFVPQLLSFVFPNNYLSISFYQHGLKLYLDCIFYYRFHSSGLFST